MPLASQPAQDLLSRSSSPRQIAVFTADRTFKLATVCYAFVAHILSLASQKRFNLDNPVPSCNPVFSPDLFLFAARQPVDGPNLSGTGGLFQ